jgi:hypothetical protein
MNERRNDANDCQSDGRSAVASATPANIEEVPEVTVQDVPALPGASTGSPNGDPSCPSASTPDNHWPEWMKRHVSFIQAGATSSEFDRVLQKFIELETSLGFPTGQVTAGFAQLIKRNINTG